MAGIQNASPTKTPGNGDPGTLPKAVQPAGERSWGAWRCIRIIGMVILAFSCYLAYWRTYEQALTKVPPINETLAQLPTFPGEFIIAPWGTSPDSREVDDLLSTMDMKILGQRFIAMDEAWTTLRGHDGFTIAVPRLVELRWNISYQEQLFTTLTRNARDFRNSWMRNQARLDDHFRDSRDRITRTVYPHLGTIWCPAIFPPKGMDDYTVKHVMGGVFERTRNTLHEAKDAPLALEQAAEDMRAHQMLGVFSIAQTSFNSSYTCSPDGHRVCTLYKLAPSMRDEIRHFFDFSKGIVENSEAIQAVMARHIHSYKAPFLFVEAQAEQWEMLRVAHVDEEREGWMEQVLPPLETLRRTELVVRDIFGVPDWKWL